MSFLDVTFASIKRTFKKHFPPPYFNSFFVNIRYARRRIILFLYKSVCYINITTDSYLLLSITSQTHFPQKGNYWNKEEDAMPLFVNFASDLLANYK